MANIFKTTDSGGLVGMLRDFALAIRQFFGTKSEMDVVATALTDLDNRKIEASDIPTSLPANGGNADTLDGYHASDFATAEHTHSYLPLSGGSMTGNISFPNDSHGIYFLSGCGIEKWSGYGPMLVAEGNKTDFWIRNGINRDINYLILHAGNYNSYAPKLDGTGASGTWGINISGNAATASSVAWDNVTNRPTNVSQFTNDAGYITASNAKFGNYLPLSGGTVYGQLYLTGLEEGSSDVTDNTELLTSYASNNGFSDTNATGKVYRRDAIKVYNYIKWKLDSVYSAIGHTHTTSQIMGFPTSLPANGGNADTVDGYHAADFVLKTTHDEHESVIAEALSDLDSRKVDIEDMPTSLPANGGDADTVDNYHASNLAKFYLSPMSSDAPASSAKSWFTNTMPSGAGAIVYNVPGSEKTIIVGKSTGAYGHMLQLNYDDTYLRVLRYFNGSWKSDGWEKISAGYADSAGSADTAGTLNGYTADKFIQNITVRNVITGAPGTDAIVDATRTGSDVILDFTIPRGEQGDMKHYHDKQIDSSGRVIAYYCEVNIQWGIKLKTTLSYDYSTKMFLPIPSDMAMQSQADCISMEYEVGLYSVEGLSNTKYNWANLHWQLQCAKKGVSVYATRYSTSDSDFYFGIENSSKNPITDLTTVEILVRYENGSTYIQANIENSYGRAYYRGSGFITKNNLIIN